MLLVLAPLAPMAAVTLAYREWADPAGEISLATPSAGLKLVALRALVVSLAALPLAFLVLLAVDTWAGDVPMRLGAAWCLPGLALAALVLLAGTTRLDPFHVAIGISAAWAVLGAGRGDRGPQPAPRALPRPHRHPGRADRGPRGPRRRCPAHRRPSGRRHLPEVRMTTTASTATGSAIEVTGLEKRFGRNHAVDGVSLAADRGVIGLLGPNGAGKTTLLRMLATVLAPDAGELRLLGRDPADPRERVEIRRRLGYLPQSPGLYPGFTPFDMVDYVAVLKEHTDRDWRRDEVRRVLESVGLDDVMHRKIRGLSGGMKQRVALAAAMIGSPELLVLDEPANGLDPEQRLQLRSLLSTSQTVLMSTHNISEVSALCHRVYVMFAGRVQFTGTPAELAGLAADRVWEDDVQDPRAIRSWLTATGTYRHLGDPPAGAQVVDPTLDDGYLLLARREHRS